MRLSEKEAKALGLVASKRKRPKATQELFDYSGQRHTLFLAMCRAHGLPDPEPEYVFHSVRRWRLDYAWPEERVALEVEGVSKEGTRHQRIGGYIADLEKYNAAAVLGWRLIRCTPQQVKSGSIFHTVKLALARIEN